MKGWGNALTTAGLLLAIAAIIMGSTVPQEVPYSIDLPSLTRTQDMHNLPKAQLQLLMFMGGCTLFLGGLMLLAASTLEQAVRDRSGFSTRQPVPEAAEQPTSPALSAEEIEQKREERARAEAERQALIAEGNRGERQATIVAFVAIGVAVLLLVYSMVTRERPTSSAENAAISASDNLEQLADNLEAQARDAAPEAEGR